MQDNQNTETNTNKVKTEHKRIQYKKPVRARFSAPVQTGPGAHPASFAIGVWSLYRGRSGRGVVLTTHPHLEPRLKKD